MTEHVTADAGARRLARTSRAYRQRPLTRAKYSGRDSQARVLGRGLEGRHRPGRQCPQEPLGHSVVMVTTSEKMAKR
jgi:hypothetical protein